MEPTGQKQSGQKNGLVHEAAFALLAAILAGGIGAYIGYGAGMKAGRAEVLTEQALVAEEAQKALVKAANPFNESAPAIESGYTNPFEATNPFR
ncbi:MAG: hypothetical protein AAB819_00915 [Patescibacteria group bacterium]